MMELKICNTCKKEFRPYSTQAKGLYCGYECYHKSMVSKPSNKTGKRGQVPWNKNKKLPHLSGKNHGRWRGGVSKDYRDGYNDIDYRNWRKEVYERDNYTCQKCFGKRGEYITAHHIKSWANFPTLRYTVSNGQTLCEKCHSETDTYRVRLKNKPHL